MSDEPQDERPEDDDAALPDEHVLDEHADADDAAAGPGPDDEPGEDDDVAHFDGDDLLDDAVEVDGRLQRDRPAAGVVPDAPADDGED